MVAVVFVMYMMLVVVVVCVVAVVRVVVVVPVMGMHSRYFFLTTALWKIPAPASTEVDEVILVSRVRLGEASSNGLFEAVRCCLEHVGNTLFHLT